MCHIKDTLVLVIDDNPDSLLLMELTLLQDGYNVEKACCGKEGVTKIHQLVPDLIILDVMMPDMTGFEVVEHIKLYEHLSHIPIIICTANNFVCQENAEKVEGFFYKPINIDNILAQVNSLLARCHSVNSTTLKIDVEDKDSLHLNHK